MSFLRTLWIGIVTLAGALAVAALVACVGLVLFVFCTPAHGATRPRTFSYDYRNAPNVSRLEGFATVVLAARGASIPEKVDSVHAWGGEVLALVQPTLACSNKVPWENSPWDASLWAAARATGGGLRYANGATVWMFEPSIYAAQVWDLTNPKQIAALAEAVAALPCDGIVLDYGCPWLDVANELGDDWPVWIEGWERLVDQVRARRPAWRVVCQCQQFTPSTTPLRCDGLLLERVGTALNPPAKVWQNVTSDPESRFLLRQEGSTPSWRRMFAGISLLTDADFAQIGDPNKVPPVSLKNPEHWSLELGIAPGGWWTRAPGVFQRMYMRGLCIVNLSAAHYPYAYNASTTYSIPPLDALVLQNRDARGRFMSPRTTAGL